ncbi:hypothetical protein EV360DRAFT_95249 [Lentinula raphanica]|nr:hypothetical protein EV360DRAFT_95249 [Lentinula raphanica]
MMVVPPQHVEVLIIGGGPAGSYAASVLSREGLDVAVLESCKFPRYTDFVALGADNNAWNVTRSEFDQLLLNHAQDCGAKVFEETKATSITFDEKDKERPIAVSWARTPVTGSITFTHLIDASGRAGLLSTKYLRNRHFNASLKNIAVWGYWHAHSTTCFGMYGKGTSRQGAPWFEALTDESGWAWFIPLHNGKTSVGIVMNQARYNAQTQSRSSSSETPQSESSLVSRYLSNLRLAPGLMLLLQGSVRSASDFSYSAPSYAGKGYRIAGDAGAFIDPFFSSGIHLAFTGALSAAASICASRRGDCTESEAAIWHTKRVAVSYTRFQVVVLSAYKQMRAQTADVLSDIDEDDYDMAFTFSRPGQQSHYIRYLVIQGASDMGSRLSESELQRSLDFCINLFNPTSPDEHKAVEEELASLDRHKGLIDVAAPLVDPKTFEDVLKVRPAHCDPKRSFDTGAEPGDLVAENKSRMVLDKINARRLVHSEYAINNLEAEELQGYAVRLEQGRLGLVQVA